MADTYRSPTKIGTNSKPTKGNHPRPVDMIGGGPNTALLAFQAGQRVGEVFGGV